MQYHTLAAPQDFSGDFFSLLVTDLLFLALPLLLYAFGNVPSMKEKEQATPTQRPATQDDSSAVKTAAAALVAAVAAITSQADTFGASQGAELDDLLLNLT